MRPITKLALYASFAGLSLLDIAQAAAPSSQSAAAIELRCDAAALQLMGTLKTGFSTNEFIRKRKPIAQRAGGNGVGEIAASIANWQIGVAIALANEKVAEGIPYLDRAVAGFARVCGRDSAVYFSSLEWRTQPIDENTTEAKAKVRAILFPEYERLHRGMFRIPATKESLWMPIVLMAGDAFLQAGRKVEAIELFNRALAMATNPSRAHGSDELASLSRLAEAYRMLDMPAERMATIERVLELAKIEPGFLEARERLHGRGADLLCRDTDDANKQEDGYCMRALALAERVFGAADRRLIPFLDDLSLLYTLRRSNEKLDESARRADLEKALALEQRAFAIAGRTKASKKAELVERLIRQARLHAALRRDSDALNLAERAFSIGRTISDARFDLGPTARLFEILNSSKRALAVRIHEINTADRRGGATMLQLLSTAEAQDDSGNSREAEQLRQRARGRAERLIRNGNWKQVSSEMEVPLRRYSVGNIAKPHPLAKLAVAALESSENLNDAHVADTLLALAMVQRFESESSTRRLALTQRALSIMEKARGTDHPDLARYLYELAQSHRAMKQPEQGLPLLERAVAITRQAPITSSDFYQQLDSHLKALSEFLELTGQFQKALTAAQLALAHAHDAEIPARKRVASAHDLLRSIYAKTDNRIKEEEHAKLGLGLIEQSGDEEDVELALFSVLLVYFDPSKNRNDCSNAIPYMLRGLALAERLGQQRTLLGAARWARDVATCHRLLGAEDAAVAVEKREQNRALKDDGTAKPRQ